MGRLKQAEWFVWLTGRVLEQRRFAYHFLGGDASAVEGALFAYAGVDGGFGYALEPDLRGPASEPLCSAYAVRLLDEVGLCDFSRVEALLDHFSRISASDGGLPARNPSPGDYPAAAAVPRVSDPPGSLQSTGPVVGLLHRNGVRHPWLEKATEFCWDSVSVMDHVDPYIVEAAVMFLDGVADRERARSVARELGELVRDRRLAVLSPSRASSYPLPEGYPPGLYFYPYDFAHKPSSVARSWFSDAEMAVALDYLSSQQEVDGGWAMRFPSWAPSTRLEWRPILTIEALLTLRAYHLL
jgi:hypothetical protein